MAESKETDVLVLGAGPGGYSAAFRAADLGLSVTLVDAGPRLGGVCLNVGCIPSKELLHVAKAIHDQAHLADNGVSFGASRIDLDRVRAGKQRVVERLTGGLQGLAKQRKVRVVYGRGVLRSANSLEVEGEQIGFRHAIIATGSRPARIPGLPDDERVMDSTGALELAEIPGKLLVIGGGYIGLEMATVYDALGSEVTVVEMAGQLLPGADPDLVKPLAKRLGAQFSEVLTGTRVAGVKAQKNGLMVSLDGPQASGDRLFDRVLVAVGRRPNSEDFGAEAAGIALTERGFVRVDAQLRTSVPHIHAIGDVAGDPMLAHKAVHEGKVAAEAIAGHKVGFDALAIPAVVFTDPEVAWAGVTEREAREQGTPVAKAVFPWAANGRSLTLGRDEGMTKLLFDPESRRVLGVGIVGPAAGDLIAEGVLAIEMGADVEDLALSIHPHPTLSETLGMAAEVAAGTVTDIVLPKR